MTSSGSGTGRTRHPHAARRRSGQEVRHRTVRLEDATSSDDDHTINVLQPRLEAVLDDDHRPPPCNGQDGRPALRRLIERRASTSARPATGRPAAPPTRLQGPTAATRRRRAQTPGGRARTGDRRRPAPRPPPARCDPAEALRSPARRPRRGRCARPRRHRPDSAAPTRAGRRRGPSPDRSPPMVVPKAPASA